jgi:hypothetical protein
MPGERGAANAQDTQNQQKNGWTPSVQIDLMAVGKFRGIF